MLFFHSVRALSVVGRYHLVDIVNSKIGSRSRDSQGNSGSYSHLPDLCKNQGHCNRDDSIAQAFKSHQLESGTSVAPSAQVTAVTGHCAGFPVVTGNRFPQRPSVLLQRSRQGCQFKLPKYQELLKDSSKIGTEVLDKKNL